MMKLRSWFFCISIGLFFFFNVSDASSKYSIVFVHIGHSLPPHVEVALSQARLFNPECEIILLTNQVLLDHFSPIDSSINPTLIAVESIPMTTIHQNWKERLIIRDWNIYSERFLYLYDLLELQPRENVFHMEHDNMLYVNLEELLPVFTSSYRGIGVTFDNDENCVCGFMYIANLKALKRFAIFMENCAHLDRSDMRIPSFFKTAFGKRAIDNLPILMSEYVQEQHELESYHHHKASNKYDYCNNANLFQSIFDAAALGQYLVGTHRGPPAGFINEACVFNASKFTYEWRLDDQNRRVPYILYNGKRYRINNLHVHSKNLAAFSSRVSGLYTLGHLSPIYYGQW